MLPTSHHWQNVVRQPCSRSQFKIIHNCGRCHGSPSHSCTPPPPPPTATRSGRLCPRMRAPLGVSRAQWHGGLLCSDATRCLSPDSPGVLHPHFSFVSLLFRLTVLVNAPFPTPAGQSMPLCLGFSTGGGGRDPGN